MPRATPYSVMEVPRTGMSAVAEAAAWRGAVALAIIRSTPPDTKPLMMVAQVGVSPAAFWGSSSTWPGSRALMASVKPSVAASSAGWGASWQMPIL